MIETVASLHRNCCCTRRPKAATKNRPKDFDIVRTFDQQEESGADAGRYPGQAGPAQHIRFGARVSCVVLIERRDAGVSVGARAVGNRKTGPWRKNEPGRRRVPGGRQRSTGSPSRGAKQGALSAVAGRKPRNLPAV